MRKLIVMFSLLFFAATMLFGQGRITGILKDKVSDDALPGAFVSLKGTSFTTNTDKNGAFVLQGVPQGKYVLAVSYEGYLSYNKDVALSSDVLELGVIFLEKDKNDVSQDVIVELSENDILNNDEGLQTNVSGVLHGSKDVFLNTAGYTFGPMRFRVRGYDNKYSGLYMNGIQTNDMESGRAVWAYWGGLNDAVRNKETYKGIAESDFAFGGIGGITGIDTRASKIRVGTKLTYSFTNRSYKHRAMFIHSTGMMKNGWALAVSGSRRFAAEGYTEGTFYDAYAYFVSGEKKINDKHSLGLVFFGAPSKRGGRSATTQEVYDLTSTRYNPNWGWQDGEKRNARVTDGHTPMAIFTHYWNIDKSSNLKTSLAYARGKYNKSSLNWYNAADPRPDYYRYLPSYMTDPAAALLRTNEFKKGLRQLDWDAMYQTNYTNIDTVFNADGVSGNTLIGKRSEYIIENRRNENNQWWLNTVYNKIFGEHLSLSAGLQYRNYKGRHYNTLEDLLGGDFVVDIDKYAERDLAGEGVADNDIRHPNRIVNEIGQVLGNDYYAHVNYSQLWANAGYSIGKFDAYLGLEASSSIFWRNGNMQNGKFPDNSLGDSEKFSFFNYGAKLGTTYKITGKHFLHIDAFYGTKAPYFRNAFVSPRTRNQAVEGLESEQIMSVQGGYILQSSNLKATVDLYYTQFKNQAEVRSFYFDGYKNFVNFVMTGIDKTHQGIEFGAEYTILAGLSVYGVGNLGYYRWTSRPSFSVYVDNSAEAYVEKETAYTKGFLVSGTPQTAFSAGIKYWAPKYWWIGLSANYMDNTYLAFSALTRTTGALKYADHSTEAFKELINQDKMSSYYTLDAFAGKSFRFKYKYYLNISLNITNILNNKSIVTGGYEQARLDLSNYDKFQPKLYYFSGLQYYLNINFRF